MRTLKLNICSNRIVVIFFQVDTIQTNIYIVFSFFGLIRVQRCHHTHGVRTLPLNSVNEITFIVLQK